MQAFAAATQFPQFGSQQTYAAHPVWKDSTRMDVKFVPMPKKQAVKIYHDARRFERQTRQAVPSAGGCIRTRDGVVGRCGLAVLHALLFDFLNYNSGRLDPSYAAIADRACVSVRSVARALVKLKAAGILNWVRRCSEAMIEGRYKLEQDTNAYGVVPSTQWRGFWTPPAGPPPPPWSIGAMPPLPSPMGPRDALAVLDAHRARLRASPPPPR